LWCDHVLSINSIYILCCCFWNHWSSCCDSFCFKRFHYCMCFWYYLLYYLHCFLIILITVWFHSGIVLISSVPLDYIIIPPLWEFRTLSANIRNLRYALFFRFRRALIRIFIFRFTVKLLRVLKIYSSFCGIKCRKIICIMYFSNYFDFTYYICPISIINQ